MGSSFGLAVTLHVVLLALVFAGMRGPHIAPTGPHTMVTGSVTPLPLVAPVPRAANQAGASRVTTASTLLVAGNEQAPTGRHRSNAVKPQRRHGPALRIAHAVAAPQAPRADELTIAPRTDTLVDRDRKARLAALQAIAGSPLPESGVAPSPGYAEKVARRVRANVVAPFDMQGNPSAVIAVTCTPSGALLSVTVQRPSGNPRWDRAVVAAVEKSDPMPRDVDGNTPASFVITFQPKG
ncbi:colicin import membrane protein [Paraburkholderia sp. BL10I2N1]|nr:colicin import membrane protein [Paraburkholderia sp. BL10I2N1]